MPFGLGVGVASIITHPYPQNLTPQNHRLLVGTMPRLPEDTSYKSICPCCPYSAGEKGGISRSDHVRRHVKRVHKEVPWGYIDPGSWTLQRIGTLNRAIKYNPSTQKYGTIGFCFDCASYIPCPTGRSETKISVVTDHTCKVPKTRERKVKVGAKSSVPIVRMTSNIDRIEASLKKAGYSIELDDDLNTDWDKTFRLNKGGGGGDLWATLKAHPELKEKGINLTREEDEMREAYADDPDEVPFSPEAVLVQKLINEHLSTKRIIAANSKVATLKLEVDIREAEIERLNRLLKDKEEEFEHMQEQLYHYKKERNDPELTVTEITADAIPLDSSECVPIKKNTGEDGYCTQ